MRILGRYAQRQIKTGYMRGMFNYLQQNPLLGAVTSFGGGFTITMTEVLTSDTFTKVVGSLAGLMGLAVGVLTVVAKAVTLLDGIKERSKK